ncbi:MAG TPA: imidazolonepropionase [Gemmatimonadales bacterium]|nr:imidazolonepropionase [Gemmatimonadales bacterium]
MPVLTNISTLYTCAGAGQGDVGPIADAALAWEGDVVRWVGPAGTLPATYRDWPREDAEGGMVIPGLVDCHTHLAFGGWRADDFERRIRGETYLQIAEAGGGIASTVRRTRALSDSDLTERAAGFLAEMVALGVTTVEAKSGYGLELDAELRILRTYRQLDERGPARIVSTFLGAHAVPPEYAGRRAEYLALVVDQMIPAVARERLAAFCDVFVERSAFSLDEARQVFRAAAAAGLRPKLHADQLTAAGGAELAAEVGAVSADHLEHTTAAGISALARSGVVAVSLPLATLYLGQRPQPSRAFIDAGVPVAVATDFNPGSAPSNHLPLALLLACTLQRMTPAEALKGATLFAARALALEETIGSLQPGKQADFAVIDAPEVAQWLSHFRPNACRRTVIGGVTAWSPGSIPYRSTAP